MKIENTTLLATCVLTIDEVEVRLLNSVFDGYVGLAEMLGKEMPSRYPPQAVKKLNEVFHSLARETRASLKRIDDARAVFVGQGDL